MGRIFSDVARILPGLVAATCIQSAFGATLAVTDRGQDSPSCGSSLTNACRTISQAIENASDGDAIEVGPGHYGNVSGDPNFTGPGDEHASSIYLESLIEGCILCVGKAVQIYSLLGAGVTVIAGSPSNTFASNVMIYHDGVVFGAPGHGFTITGGNSNGVSIARGPSPWTQNVVVSGNIDVQDQNGFVFSGLDYSDHGYCASAPRGFCDRSAQILFSGNQAVGNAVGFNVTVNLDFGGSIVVRDNTALGAGTGFAVNPGFQYEDGAVIFPANVSLIENVASEGGVGFASDEDGNIARNTAIGNSTAGFYVKAPAQELFQGNSAIGNGGPGVIVDFSPDPFTLEPYRVGFSSFSQNNFWGNDRNRPALFLSVIPGQPAPYGGINPGPSAHCGVLNVGALAALLLPQAPPSPIIELQASYNYWGSAQGPESTGVGDTVGGACDQNGGATNSTPFSTTQFTINVLN